jgi:hypothetical protein
MVRMWMPREYNLKAMESMADLAEFDQDLADYVHYLQSWIMSCNSRRDKQNIWHWHLETKAVVRTG